MEGVPGDVKRRDYDSSGRQARSDATRRRILDTARSLILRQGYASTTVAGIAREAGVHVDTIYALVGRKPDIVADLVEQALSGLDHAVPAVERPYVAAIRTATDPREKLAIYAAATRQMLERLAPLFVALRDAAGTDPAARELWRRFSDRRAENMRVFVADVAGAGGLRTDPDEAADAVWATNSPEVYVMLTEERGWTPERYERWLREAWERLLLPG